MAARALWAFMAGEDLSDFEWDVDVSYPKAQGSHQAVPFERLQYATIVGYVCPSGEWKWGRMLRTVAEPGGRKLLHLKPLDPRDAERRPVTVVRYTKHRPFKIDSSRPHFC